MSTLFAAPSETARLKRDTVEGEGNGRASAGVSAVFAGNSDEGLDDPPEQPPNKSKPNARPAAADDFCTIFYSCFTRLSRTVCIGSVLIPWSTSVRKSTRGMRNLLQRDPDRLS